MKNMRFSPTRGYNLEAIEDANVHVCSYHTARKGVVTADANTLFYVLETSLKPISQKYGHVTDTANYIESRLSVSYAYHFFVIS